ncbi:MAG: YraN family protein [Chitinophagales bacterium]|nr:YraN family protein [Chitinophagales bacterium]
MAEHNTTGKIGEEAAVKFLTAAGHEILQCNYRYGRAEIDVISKHNGLLVFTEVKTRESNRYGFPEEFVDAKKISLVKRAAEEYVYQQQWEGEVRFDIISVTLCGNGANIHHIPDAFFYEEE